MTTQQPVKLNGTRQTPVHPGDALVWYDADATTFQFQGQGMVIFARMDPTAGVTAGTIIVEEVDDFQGRQTAAQATVAVDETKWLMLGEFGRDGWEDGSGEVSFTVAGAGSANIQVCAIRDWGALY